MKDRSGLKCCAPPTNMADELKPRRSAITRIDGRLVGTGKPGPMHARMFALYKEYKQAFIQGKVE